ncbi:RDD family protein [Streptomyces triticiradicis]|uniref:RDD family protein n=1 Tax=Streptomyces triticiradicis TaxID=2651189 RepID=A0A7J5D493_9ACTN|nr:RDD family protein [Streptomyces triticiradicis]
MTLHLCCAGIRRTMLRLGQLRLGRTAPSNGEDTHTAVGCRCTTVYGIPGKSPEASDSPSSHDTCLDHLMTTLYLGERSTMPENPDRYIEIRKADERPEPVQWPSRPGYAPPTPLAPAACPACGKAATGELSYQFCGQVFFLPKGLPLATIGLRFDGYLLEGVLIVFTFGIGWPIWALFLFPQGQTPAKQLLQMRLVHIAEPCTARFWRISFREFIAKPIISVLAIFAFLILYFWLFWDRNRQELRDKLASTPVVKDQQGLLHPSQHQESAAAVGSDAWSHRGAPPEVGDR